MSPTSHVFRIVVHRDPDELPSWTVSCDTCARTVASGREGDKLPDVGLLVAAHSADPNTELSASPGGGVT